MSRKRALQWVTRAREYQEEWLARANAIEYVVPAAQQDLERTRWMEETLRDMPEDMEHTVDDTLMDRCREHYESWTHSYELLPLVDLDGATSASALNTSGASQLYDVVVSSSTEKGFDLITYLSARLWRCLLGVAGCTGSAAHDSITHY